jgi:hypothetical protein
MALSFVLLVRGEIYMLLHLTICAISADLVIMCVRRTALLAANSVTLDPCLRKPVGGSFGKSKTVTLGNEPMQGNP